MFYAEGKPERERGAMKKWMMAILLMSRTLLFQGEMGHACDADGKMQ